MSAKGKEGIQWWPKRTIIHRMKKVDYSNVLLKKMIFIGHSPGKSAKNKQMKEHKKTKSMLKPDRCLKQKHKKGWSKHSFCYQKSNILKKISSSQRNTRNLWFKKKFTLTADNHTALIPMNITCSFWWETEMAQNFWKPLGKTGIPGVTRLLAASQGGAKASGDCN